MSVTNVLSGARLPTLPGETLETGMSQREAEEWLVKRVSRRGRVQTWDASNDRVVSVVPSNGGEWTVWGILPDGTILCDQAP